MANEAGCPSVGHRHPHKVRPPDEVESNLDAVLPIGKAVVDGAGGHVTVVPIKIIRPAAGSK